jgi:hypothetical protein
VKPSGRRQKAFFRNNEKQAKIKDYQSSIPLQRIWTAMAGIVVFKK